MLMQTISKVRRSINPNLQIDGILLTLTDSRTNLSRSTVNQVRELYQGTVHVFESEIPSSVKVGESSITGESILFYDRKNPVATAYTPGSCVAKFCPECRPIIHKQQQHQKDMERTERRRQKRLQEQTKIA